MARGRKSSIVKTLTGRDTKLLIQLSKTGISAHDQAKLYCNLSIERLEKLEKSGYIKTSNHAVVGVNTKIIQLDKQGKQYCKENFDIRSFCQAQTNHLTHDLRLTEVYYTLEPEVQSTWQHEVDLINEIYEEHPNMKGNLENCVDARIKVNGEYIAIESIGDSYTSKDLQIKNGIATTLLKCSKMEAI
jgi:hypothetical protein